MSQGISETMTINDTTLVVEGCYTPGQPMKYPSMNDELGQPAEDPDIEIEHIFVKSLDYQVDITDLVEQEPTLWEKVKNTFEEHVKEREDL